MKNKSRLFLAIITLLTVSINAQCWQSFAEGSSHTLAIKLDGTLWAWGLNSSGQLGDGTTGNKTIPVQIGTAGNWKSISGGGYFSMGIKTDGTLWAWGDNTNGQLGDGTLISKNIPTQVGTATDWQFINLGLSHAIAIKTDGTLWTWGLNNYGQLGDGTTVDKNAPAQIGLANNWQSACGGDDFTITIQNNGTLWAFGRNDSGQLGDGTSAGKLSPVQIGGATNWAAAASGQSHSIATKTDGTLWAWGYNFEGALGNGTTTFLNAPLQVGTGTNWKAVGANYRHSIATQTNGTLWAWGYNGTGQLGDGSTANKNIPTQIGTNTNWIYPDAGFFNGTAIQNNGTILDWGINNAGQIGDGTTADKNTPVTVLTACNIDAALDFDGINDIVAVPASANLDNLGLSAFTMESWVYPRSASGAHSIIRKSGDYNLYINGGNLAAEIWPLGTSNPSWQIFNTTSALTVNMWSHVAFVWNGTTGIFYINGVAVSSTNSSGSVPASENLYLGASSIYGNYLDGILDETRIWNVARTSCEITTYKNCEIPTTSAGLVANYHFNQGFVAATNTMVTSLTDASGNSNNGSLNNFALTGTVSNWVTPGGVVSGSITPMPPPIVGAVATNTAVCPGNSTILNGTGAVTYTYTGGVTNGVAFTPAATTTYSVYGTSAAGCTSTNNAVVTVVVKPIPLNQTVIPSTNNILCGGSGTVGLTSTQAGINYYLRNDANNAILAGPLEGTGPSITFGTGVLNVTTTLNINAVRLSGGITLNGFGGEFITPSNSSLNFPGDFTLEAWIKTTGSGTRVIIGNPGTSDYWLGINNGLPTFIIKGLGTQGPSMVNDGLWHHIAGAKLSGTKYLYVDGILVASNADNNPTSSYGQLEIGGYQNNGAYFFQGQLDEVRIWNTGKTQAQIQSNMNSCLVGNEAGLLVYYAFENGSGSTFVTDIAGGNNNANLFGASPATTWIYGRENCGGCSNQMAIKPVFSIVSLTDQAVTPATSTLVCSGSTTFSLNSESGVNYYLRNDATNAVLAGPVAGTGGAITLMSNNISSATTFNVNAMKATGGLSFDGVNDFVSISNKINSAGDFTWEAWIKTGADGTIFSLSPPAGGWNLGGKSLFVRSGKISFEVAGNGYIETPGTYNDNAWHHVALTTQANFSGLSDNVKMYVDGNFILSKTNWDMNSFSESGLINKIGYTNINFPSTPAFPGVIDEVSVWTTVRTPAQIIADMNNCLLGNEAGLSAYYRFEDGTGSTLTDIAGGNNTGVLTNMNNITAWVNGRDNCATCSMQMSLKQVVSITTPSDQTLTVVTPSFCGSGSTTVNSGSSQTGFNYYLNNNATNSIVTGPFAGTGSALSLTTGLISSTTTYNVNAKKTGYALQFNSSNNVQGSDAGLPTGNAPRTMEAWIKTTSASNSNIFEYGTLSNNLRSAMLMVNQKLYFSGQNNDVQGTILINNGAFHHVAVTYDGTTMKLYVDGVLDVSQAIPALNTVSNIFRMGMNTLGTEKFNGIIDEVRVWNVARTPAQIKSDMNDCLTGSEPNLTAYYNFENGPGGTALNDLAGGNNNGFLSNSNTLQWVSGKDNCGCTLQMSTLPTVTIISLPVVTASATNSIICNGASTTLNGGGADTYTWTGGVTDAISFSPSATLSYTVTGTNTLTGCTSTNSAVQGVTVNSLPIVATSVTNPVICEGASTTLNGNGADTYTWTGGVTDGVAFSPTLTASYTVTGTNTLTGCTSTNTANETVTVNALPLITVNSGAICNGQSFTMTPGGASTYTFSNGSAIVTPLANSSYSVTGTDANGCVCAIPAVSDVTVNALPVISVNSGVICNGQSFTMTPSGATTYTFSNGSSIVTPGSNSSYSVTGTDLNGCVSPIAAVSDVTVNALPLVTASISSSVICEGATTILNGSGADTYTWTGGVIDGSAFSPSVTASYSVTGTSTLTGCTSTNTAFETVTVNPLPIVTASSSNSAICIGDAATLNGGGADTYTWTGGVTNGSSFSPTVTGSYTVTGTNTLTGCTSTNTAFETVTVNTLPLISVNSASVCNGQSFTMTPSGATTYTFSNGSAIVSPTISSSYSVTGTDANGCVSAIAAVSDVTVNALPVISVNSGAICNGQSFTLTPTGATTYTFSNGSAVVTPTANETYTVTGSTQGCTGSSAVVSSVTVNALPIVLASANSSLICTGETASLTASGANTYTWSTNATGSNMADTPTVTTTYTVTGTDGNGCENTAVIIQSVSLCTGVHVLSANTSLIGVYPNPTTGMVTLELNTSTQVIVMNPLGQILSTESLPAGIHQLDIKNQANGVYFVKVIQNNKQQTIKLFKE